MILLLEVAPLNENERMAKQLSKNFSDKQALKGKQPQDFDHEFANEPLSTTEKMNNKKTKKRQ